jgi:ribonuclease BN (tRNA processing enzyme)
MRATPEQWQTNAVLTHEKDGAKRHLLIDVGGDNRHALAEAGIKTEDIDGVYISHLHPDHVNGLGDLAVAMYFHPKLDRPKLFSDIKLMPHMWEHCLKGGCETVEGKVMNLTDYFDCKPVIPNGSFEWAGLKLTPVQTLHVVAGYQFMHSFGLMIEVPEELVSPGGEGRRLFYTSDTQFCPHQIQCFYNMADKIIHDCETTKGFKSKVHAHWDDLCTLDAKTKRKMHLVHYQPDNSLGAVGRMDKAVKAGFAGFVEKGDSFDLEGM